MLENSESSLELPPSSERFENEPDDFFQVGTEGSGLRVYLRYALFRALDDFALRDTSREQAGLLLGRRDPRGGYMAVEEALEAGIDEGGSRFTERTWQRARRVAKHRYPRLEVVGWFHTHPGTGVELSAEEIAVHRKFFAEPWQVVYAVDPVLRERNFHIWREGDLVGASGFRIYGKEEKAMTVPEREPVRPDEHLRERYLERSLEKLQRLVRRPPARPIDYVNTALLVAILAVLLFRPAPPVKVDQKELVSGQQQLSEQVAALSGKMTSLEKHLAEMQIIDQQLGLEPAAPESPEPAPAPEETPAAASPKPEPTKPAAADPGAPAAGTKVRLHKVRNGDTLSTICEKYYKSADPKVVAALGRFNKLKPPNFDIWPGDTVKIPARATLKV